MKVKIHFSWHILSGLLRYLTPCAFFFMAIIVVSCNQAKTSDKQVFHYNEQTGIASLDPAFAKNQSIMWGIHQIYNTLVETDPSLNIVPSLAKSWEVSPDRLLYTFHLRTDVVFHDNKVFPNGKGRKMTAQDV